MMPAGARRGGAATRLPAPGFGATALLAVICQGWSVGLLRRFDAADAHDADGYGSSSSWLAAKAGVPERAADRYLQLGTMFGDAGVIRGDLTPGCNAAVRAVLEALGKKAGPEDDRTEGQRFHDALQLACALLPRVCGQQV